MKVEEMINKFEQDMAGFEMRSSTIYLQEVQVATTSYN